LRIEAVALQQLEPPNVTLVKLRETRWPELPSNATRAILFAAPTDTVLVSPIAIWAVLSTSAAVYGEGGTKMTPLEVAVPVGVATTTWPLPGPPTVVVRLVALAAVI
jgi:hypothetical protein